MHHRRLVFVAVRLGEKMSFTVHLKRVFGDQRTPRWYTHNDLHVGLSARLDEIDFVCGLNDVVVASCADEEGASGAWISEGLVDGFLCSYGVRVCVKIGMWMSMYVRAGICSRDTAYAGHQHHLHTQMHNSSPPANASLITSMITSVHLVYIRPRWSRERWDTTAYSSHVFVLHVHARIYTNLYAHTGKYTKDRGTSTYASKNAITDRQTSSL